MTKGTYEGLCRLCGAHVVVVAEFLACDYYTCNMDTTGALAPHSGADLRDAYAGWPR